MAATEPIRSREQVCAFINHYRDKGQVRNWVLTTMGVFSALRISDILRLSCDDVYSFQSGSVRIRNTISLKEQKTEKCKRVALNKEVIKALKAYMPEARPGKPLILNPRTGKAISRIQAYRLIQSAAEAVGIEGKVSCHSLRKTFGYHAWKNGVSPAVIMEIYNHSSLAVTRRYLGVSQSDMNEVYLGMEFNLPQKSTAS